MGVSGQGFDVGPSKFSPLPNRVGLSEFSYNQDHGACHPTSSPTPQDAVNYDGVWMPTSTYDTDASPTILINNQPYQLPGCALSVAEQFGEVCNACCVMYVEGAIVDQAYAVSPLVLLQDMCMPLVFIQGLLHFDTPLCVGVTPLQCRGYTILLHVRLQGEKAYLIRVWSCGHYSLSSDIHNNLGGTRASTHPKIPSEITSLERGG